MADFSDLRLELASEVFSSEVVSSSSLRPPFFFLAMRNRPPHPLSRFIACKCRDSCIYGWNTSKIRTNIREGTNQTNHRFYITFFDFMSLFRASSSALDCLRLSIPWYCFALTKTGSSTASYCNGTTCWCIPINCIWTWRQKKPYKSKTKSLEGKTSRLSDSNTYPRIWM